MSDGQWVSVGGGANDVYLGNRLTYRADFSKGDEAFQPVSAKAAVLTSTVLFFGTFFIAPIPAIIVEYVFRSNPLATIVWLAGVVLLCLIPWREWVSQWELTLDGKGTAAESVYTTIIDSLQRDHIPVSVGRMRIRPKFNGPIRNYLVMTEKPYYAYVGVFAYGDGLFMTWSMWRTRRIIVLPWLFLWESLRRAVGRGNVIHDILRTDQARAMREAIHNAVREGVDAAAVGLDADSALLQSIPVEDEGAERSSSIPRPRPPRPASPVRPSAPPPAPAPVAPTVAPGRPVPPVFAPTPAPSAPAAGPTVPAAQPPPPDPTQRIE